MGAFLPRQIFESKLLSNSANQRWLAIRLDFMGAILIFVVAIMAVADVGGVNPAQIGLVLVYCVSLTQTFSMVTRQSAEVEVGLTLPAASLMHSPDTFSLEQHECRRAHRSLHER